MRIGDESRDDIHQEVDWASMPCMLNLRYVLQLVMNGLNDGSLPYHELVKDRHKLALHVPSESGHQLDSIGKQLPNRPFTMSGTGSLSSVLPGVRRKARSSPWSLTTRCTLKP